MRKWPTTYGTGSILTDHVYWQNGVAAWTTMRASPRAVIIPHTIVGSPCRGGRNRIGLYIRPRAEYTNSYNKLAAIVAGPHNHSTVGEPDWCSGTSRMNAANLERFCNRYVSV